MRNGDPTSLRMGFGYLEAAASGVTGFKRPPTPSEMDFHLKEKVAEKKLRELVQAHPSIAPQMKHLIKKYANEWTFQDFLFVGQAYSARHAKNGFVVTGGDGKVYRSRKVYEVFTDGLCVHFNGGRFMLYRHYVVRIDINPPGMKAPR